MALYGAVVVWLGFVYSICYTGSFHQLCESVFFVFIVRVKSAFAFMGKKVFAKNKEAVVIYGFMLLLWIFRVVMAIVCPCPPESNVWMSYGQLGGSVIVMFLLLVPFIRIAVAMWESKKGGI